MRLLRLFITGFGTLRERTVAFAPGLTVLLGRNEAGKSTVLHCLSQVLLGKPTQRSNFPDFVPWDGGAFAAAVECEEGGAHYRLTRRFDESGTRAVTLHRLGADDTEQLVTQEAGEVRKWLSGALGTADDRIFYRVYCLSQAEFTPLDNFAGLRDHLERVVSGADVAVAAAVARVDDRLAAVRKGVAQPALAQNWGALKRTEESRRDWEARLHEAQRQERHLAEARGMLGGLQQQLSEHRARVELIAEMLEQDRRRRDLLAHMAELHTSWSATEGERERIAHLTGVCARLQALQEQLPPPFAEPAALRALLPGLHAADDRSAKIGWAIIILGGAFAVYITLCANQLAGLLCLLIAGAAGIPLVVKAMRVAQCIRALCEELQVQTLAEAEQRLEVSERYRRELDAATLALTAVNDPEKLTERRRQLAFDMAKIEETIHQIPGTPLTAEAAQRLTAERRHLQEALPGMQEKEQQLAREVAVLEEAERDLVDLEDGVAYWQGEEKRAREEEQQLLLARELLLEAGQQVHHSFADPLAARIAPLFSAMTGGRYPRVRVEGDAKSFHVQPLDATGAPVPPAQLSRGAGDQFILAVRLALGQVIAGTDGTPIFLLDDPLLHFDAARRQEALAMLADLSQHAQIILATHDESLPAALPEATVVRIEIPS